MFRTLRLFAVLLCLLLSVSAAFATPTVRFGAAPAWIRPAVTGTAAPDLKEVSDGYFLRLFEQQFHAEKDEIYTHVIREIISETGVQAGANISVSFNPGYEQLTVHSVVIWRNGKPVDITRAGEFRVLATEQDLSRFIYNGSYTAYRVLSDVRPGDRIEYAYSHKGSNPVFGHRFFNQLILQGTDPIGTLHYCVLAAKSRPLNVRFYNNPPLPGQLSEGGLSVYEWNLQNVVPLRAADNMPSWYNPYQAAQFSEYKSWADVADWALRVNPPVSTLSKELRDKLMAVTVQHNDSDARFRAIVDMVQTDVRYMGIELGEYSHRATDPSKVYDRRYGDCKDKSLLLVSLLQAAGFKACMALVNTSFKDKIADYLPSPTAFNHAIVMAVVNGKEVWVDPTDSRQGGQGADIYCASYGKALLLQPGTTDLRTMPEQSAGAIRYYEEYTATGIGKPVTLVVRTVYTRAQADNMRQTLASQSRSYLEKNYQDYYSKIFGHIDALDTLSVYDNRATNTLEVSERYRVDSFFNYNAATRKYDASFYAYMIRNLLPAVSNGRTQPFALTYPYDIFCSIRMNAPLNWNIEPRGDSRTRDAYGFSYDVSAKDSQLALEYEFHAYKDHIGVADIAQYQADQKKIVDDYLAYSISYTPGADAGTTSGANTPAILAVLVLVAGLCHIGYRIFTTRTQAAIPMFTDPLPIGGWLILPVLGLAFSVLRTSYSLFSTSYFHNRLWHAFDATANATIYKGLLWFELLGNVSLVAGAVFCLILMYHKRDILPRVITILYIANLVEVVADAVAVKIFLPTQAFGTATILSSMVAAAIWIPYFRTSARVRDTFIVPYPKPASPAYHPYYPPATPGADDSLENPDADQPRSEETSAQDTGSNG